MENRPPPPGRKKKQSSQTSRPVQGDSNTPIGKKKRDPRRDQRKGKSQGSRPTCEVAFGKKKRRKRGPFVQTSASPGPGQGGGKTKWILKYSKGGRGERKADPINRREKQNGNLDPFLGARRLEERKGKERMEPFAGGGTLSDIPCSLLPLKKTPNRSCLAEEKKRGKKKKKKDRIALRRRGHGATPGCC